METDLVNNGTHLHTEQQNISPFAMEIKQERKIACNPKYVDHGNELTVLFPKKQV